MAWCSLCTQGQPGQEIPNCSETMVLAKVSLALLKVSQNPPPPGGEFGTEKYIPGGGSLGGPLIGRTTQAWQGVGA